MKLSRVVSYMVLVVAACGPTGLAQNFGADVPAAGVGRWKTVDKFVRDKHPDWTEAEIQAEVTMKQAKMTALVNAAKEKLVQVLNVNPPKSYIGATSNLILDRICELNLFIVDAPDAGEGEALGTNDMALDADTACWGEPDYGGHLDTIIHEGRHLLDPFEWNRSGPWSFRVGQALCLVELIQTEYETAEFMLNLGSSLLSVPFNPDADPQPDLEVVDMLRSNAKQMLAYYQEIEENLVDLNAELDAPGPQQNFGTALWELERIKDCFDMLIERTEQILGR